MHTIYHNFIIQASPERVFAAVSEPKDLENWWPLKCSGKAAMGEIYNFNFTDQYDWYGEVIQCEPGKTFHIKMTEADPDWNPTTFGFDLLEHEKGTALRFWHKDWPHLNEHFKIASFCWAMLLNGLKNYVEKGMVVEFEERS